ERMALRTRQARDQVSVGYRPYSAPMLTDRSWAKPQSSRAVA
ncbi:MAG: hypothetical protein QOI28_3906, partial [Mycobacterium sp.]|nr:hypothetical protein [Mycobacterium sp.]